MMFKIWGITLSKKMQDQILDGLLTSRSTFQSNLSKEPEKMELAKRGGGLILTMVLAQGTCPLYQLGSVTVQFYNTLQLATTLMCGNLYFVKELLWSRSPVSFFSTSAKPRLSLCQSIKISILAEIFSSSFTFPHLTFLQHRRRQIVPAPDALRVMD